MSNSTISITYKLKGDTGGLKELVKDVERMQQAFHDGIAPAEQLRTSLINFNQLGQAFEQIGQSVSALDSVVQDLTQAYTMQSEAETKLETVMRQRMEATTEQIQGVKDLCSAQQELGVIGDEVQLAGAQQLATFLSTDSALATLIPAMNNLVAQQKGLGATQQDCVTIANLFGKAMQGQTSALTRVGITMTEAEKKALKMGTEEQRAAMLAQIVTNNVGDMNAALAATDAGRAKQLANAMGDVKEQLGALVQGIAPYTTIASQLVAVAANAGRATVAMRGLYTTTLGANGAFKFINPTLIASVTGMNAASAAARMLATSLRLVAASTGVGLVLWGISAAVDAFTSSAAKGKDTAEQLAGATDKATASANQFDQALRDQQAQLALDIAATKNFTGTKAEEARLVNELNTRYGESLGYYSSVASWYDTLTSKSELYAKQLVIEAQARVVANRIAGHKETLYNLTHDNKGNPQEPGSNPGLSFGGKQLSGTNANISKLNKGLAESTENLIAKDEKELQELMQQAAELSKSLKSAGTKSSSGTGHSNNGATAAKTEQNELEKVEEQIRANQVAALIASDSQLAALRKETLELVEKRDRLREIQESLVNMPVVEYTPPQIDQIKTYEQLDEALNHYQNKLRQAQAEERTEINSTIKALEALKEAWDNTLNPKPKAPSELDQYIDNLASGGFAKFNSMASPLEGLSTDQLLSKLSEIRNVLNGMDGDITEQQRESLKKAATEYEKYAKKSALSMSKIKAGWGGIKGIKSGIDSISNAINDQGSAWDKLAGMVDGAFSVYEGITQVIEMIQAMGQAFGITQAATEAATTASTMGATQEAAAGAQRVATSSEVTTAKVAEASAGAMSANSSIPYVGIALGLAAVAAIIAMMSSLPKYAAGGIAFGPTIGMFGEYAGASHNPEVVAPLNKLGGLLAPYIGEADGAGALSCKVRGDQLEFVLNRRKRRRSRT
ncbi:MAG: hypothetical protein K2M87_01670 [Muribaculaceae bacterium]|nr:hypothetical protein [Muribaculaceae bacterium]